jgi:hypothetical protein
MDALKLRYPKTVHLDPKHKFCIFYVPKVSEMLWNNPKNHFGSNGVECMLYNFGTRNSAFRLETQILHLLRAEGYRNALKHSQTTFWVQWSRMDALQLRYPQNSAFRPETQVFHLLRTDVLRNVLKQSQTSFWVQWSWMDALQLRYPEIVHSGPKRKFCIFYVLKVNEMLWNTPKHHFGSNGVERMLYNFGTPK